MTQVGRKDRLTSEKTPEYGQNRVEKRDRHGYDWRRHSQEGGGFVRPNHGEATQCETDAEAAAVPKENCGGGEVVGEEPRQCTQQQSGYQRKRVLARD